jgi:thiamine transport system permease protein
MFSRSIRFVLILLPLGFLAVFYVYPLMTIFGVSLAPEGHLDLSGFSRIISGSYYLETLGFTFSQALLSTGLTLLFALPSAYVFTRYQFRGKSLLMALATLPFVLPTVVVAAAFLALIGPRGLLNQALMNLLSLPEPPIQLERTLTLILIVHVFYNYAVALRIIAGFWANQNPRIEEAARVLGASGWGLWWRIRLPILRPAILAASILVFIFTFTSFGVVLILGGPQYATLEVEIYRQATGIFNLPMAAALSLVQIGFMLLMMIVYTRLQRRLAGDLVSSVRVAVPVRSWAARLLVGGTLGFMLVMLFLPLLALVARSVVGLDGNVTVQYFQRLNLNARGSVLFVPPINAIGHSLTFALATTLLSVFLGLVTAYLLAGRLGRFGTWFDPIFMLPLATSAVTLGFGNLIALDEPPLNLRTSPLLIPLAHTLVALPFVVRSVLPSLLSLPPNLGEAARVLGADEWRVFQRIDLPIISRGLLVGATFAFTVSMGEFGATSFLARPDTATIPVVIFRLLGQPGALNYGQAMAMSVILMLVSAISFISIERLRPSVAREF